MKTILAKAMDVQGEQAKQVRTVPRFAYTMTNDHMVVVESSEFKLLALQHDMDTINKKLTILIQLLRKSIERDSKTPDMQRGGSVGSSSGYHRQVKGQALSTRPAQSFRLVS